MARVTPVECLDCEERVMTRTDGERDFCAVCGGQRLIEAPR